METVHPMLLVLLGIGVFGGTIGAWFFQRLRIPQVVAYICIGLLLGQSGFGLIAHEEITSLALLIQLALGIIGFLVGGELHWETMKKFGKQFTAILLGEGLFAFFVVAIGSGAVVYTVTSNVVASTALGLVLGAIASATDPASTIQVLWEYKAAGVFTTTLTAIVALDDALSLTLYGISSSAAQILTGNSGTILGAFKSIGLELFGSLALGVAGGAIMNYIYRRIRDRQKNIPLVVGSLLLIVGLAMLMDMDLILASMSAGVVLVNMAPRRSESLFEMIQSAAAPIYIIFFVLVGARLSLGAMPAWLWLVVVVYIVGRTVGKTVGLALGGRLTGAAPSVRKYGGLGLFCQGGVAVGLAIMASHHLGHLNLTADLALGEAIIFVVTATTLIVQLIGPSLVKLALKLADELDRDVRKDEVAAEIDVHEVMDESPVTVKENEHMSKIMNILAESSQKIIPVLNQNGNMLGVISFETIREVLTSQEACQWLVGTDVVQQPYTTVKTNDSLKFALTDMEHKIASVAPVMQEEAPQKLAGLLNLETARSYLNQELLRRQGIKKGNTSG